jgi:hypothetical protein
VTVPLFPRGTAVSTLHIYDWEAEDGLSGGTPHMHTVSTETERTRGQLAALAAGNAGHLADGAVVRGEPTPGARRFGMCGRLQTWQAPSD